MANYNTIKTAIQSVIKTNGNNEITGALLQQSLLAMINSLGGGYQFYGMATPETNPGVLDQRIFYIAKDSGTYPYLGGFILGEGKLAIFKYDNAWAMDTVEIGDSELEPRVVELENKTQSIEIDSSGATIIDGTDVGSLATDVQGISHDDETGDTIINGAIHASDFIIDDFYSLEEVGERTERLDEKTQGIVEKYTSDDPTDEDYRYDHTEVDGISIKGLSTGKQDTLIAGEGINIAADGKTISASGGAWKEMVVEVSEAVNSIVFDIQEDYTEFAFSLLIAYGISSASYLWFNMRDTMSRDNVYAISRPQIAANVAFWKGVMNGVRVGDVANTNLAYGTSNTIDRVGMLSGHTWAGVASANKVIISFDANVLGFGAGSKVIFKYR